MYVLRIHSFCPYMQQTKISEHIRHVCVCVCVSTYTYIYVTWTFTFQCVSSYMIIFGKLICLTNLHITMQKYTIQVSVIKFITVLIKMLNVIKINVQSNL
jgi:hypothetical protein